MERNDLPEFDELVTQVVGAAIAVHRELGPGFAEITFSRAHQIELEERNIPFAAEVAIALQYHGRSIGEGRIDLLIEDRLVVELKAVEGSAKRFRRQVVAYLKATAFRSASSSISIAKS